MAFTPTVLYSGELTGSGTTAVAYTSFSAKNLTGMSKANAVCKVDLKCSDISKMSSSQFEITSSGTWDNEEWQFNTSYLGTIGITSSYQTFYMPCSFMGTAYGGLDVTSINFIRWYIVATASISIGWRNCAIWPYDITDVSLNLETWAQKLEDLKNYLYTTDGIVTADILMNLETLGLNLSDAPLILDAQYQNVEDLGTFFYTIGQKLKDLPLSLEAQALAVSDARMYFESLAVKYRDAKLNLSVVDGITLKDLALSLAVTDGIVLKDMPLSLKTVNATPVFKSVTAHRLSSVLHEVV